MPIRSHPKLMDRLSIYLLTLCSQALSSSQEWSLMAAGGEETHFSPFDWGRDFCASQGHTHQWSRDWSWVFQVLWLPYGDQIPPHLHHSSMEQSQSSSSIPQPTQCSAALWYRLWTSLSRKGDFAQHLRMWRAVMWWRPSCFELITADSATTMQYMRSEILCGIHVQK